MARPVALWPSGVLECYLAVNAVSTLVFRSVAGRLGCPSVAVYYHDGACHLYLLGTHTQPCRVPYHHRSCAWVAFFFGQNSFPRRSSRSRALRDLLGRLIH